MCGLLWGLFPIFQNMKVMGVTQDFYTVLCAEFEPSIVIDIYCKIQYFEIVILQYCISKFTSNP